MEIKRRDHSRSPKETSHAHLKGKIEITRGLGMAKASQKGKPLALDKHGKNK